MKNYSFIINGNKYEVEVMEVEGNMAVIEVNGTVYNVEINNTIPKPRTVQQSVVQRQVAEARPKVENRDPRGFQVKAPLPGVILQVLVKQGDEVKSGQTLCTLETMKMENAIKSDKAGAVTSVKITPGQSVIQDEVLIEIG